MNDTLLKSKHFRVKQAAVHPILPATGHTLTEQATDNSQLLSNHTALLDEFGSTTEYLDALLQAREQAFSQQSNDGFKALKKFNQLLMK